MPYAEAVKWVRSKGIKTKTQWHALGSRRPAKLPAEPWSAYARTGDWESWDAFVGRPPTGRRFRGVVFVSYIEAATWARERGIGSALEWRELYRSAPVPVPAKPDIVYKGKGWKTWSVFLKLKSAGRRASSKYFLSYAELERFVRENDITSKAEYRRHAKRSQKLPVAPDLYFLKTGDWVNWNHFLNLPPRHVSYGEARAFAISQGFKRTTDWFRQNGRPLRVPFNPKAFYSARGDWISWDHFFGRG